MDAARRAGDEYGYAKFIVLKKVENEHARAVGMVLQIKEAPSEAVTCSKAFKESTQEGWGREDRAIKTHSKFAEETPEPQLKQFFSALVEIEKDNLKLHAENLKE